MPPLQIVLVGECAEAREGDGLMLPLVLTAITVARLFTDRQIHGPDGALLFFLSLLWDLVFFHSLSHRK